MNNFYSFIKLNPKLVHLDFQQTGLSEQIIKHFGYILTRATSLQCIHFCGNEGITEETIAYLRKRLRARGIYHAPSIVPLDKNFMA